MKLIEQREIREKGISIEPLQTQDLRSIINLQQDNALTPWTLESFEKELANPFSLMFVAIKNTAASRMPIGFFSGRVLIDELEVHDIVVASDMRGQGTGGALLLEACRQAKEKGAARAILEVRAGNLPAVSFYKTFGFEVIGRRRAYYQLPEEDAILMATELN